MAILPTLLLISTSAEEASEASIESLLSPLQGCWQGEAIKTPRGPLSYPICFKLLEGNILYGVADLRVSRHHWHFHLNNKESRLSFLSTFAGNQTPINLSAVSFASDHLTFAAHDRHYLQVEVQRLDEGYRFTIHVKGEEHVIITLVRQAAGDIP